MQLLDGLTDQDRAFLQRGSSTRALSRGEVLFREDDPAYGLFFILEGEIAVSRRGPAGDVELARLGPGEVLGEMGLVRPSARRSATARAVDAAKVLELPGQPLELVEKFPDKQLAVRFLQNLVCVLASRLRRTDRPGAPRVAPVSKGPVAHIGVLRELQELEAAPEKLFAAVDATLPKGLLSRFLRDEKLTSGEVLCSEGDEPDGFYVLREGELEVLLTDETGHRRLANTLVAPMIAGEVGFFSGERRSATLVAKGAVHITRFTAADFGKLRATRPADAARILHASAQLIACMVLRKETEQQAAAGEG